MYLLAKFQLRIVRAFGVTAQATERSICKASIGKHMLRTLSVNNFNVT